LIERQQPLDGRRSFDLGARAVWETRRHLFFTIFYALETLY
jgi:hypothetical protein